MWQNTPRPSSAIPSARNALKNITQKNTSILKENTKPILILPLTNKNKRNSSIRDNLYFTWICNRFHVFFYAFNQNTVPGYGPVIIKHHMPGIRTGSFLVNIDAFLLSLKSGLFPIGPGLKYATVPGKPEMPVFVAGSSAATGFSAGYRSP